MGSIDRGFIRTLEVLITITLMFMLLITLIKTTPPIPATEKNTLVLSRYAKDIKDMVCNSWRDRQLIIYGASLTPINNSINYAVPYDLKYRIAILNVTTLQVLDSTGYSQASTTDIATAGCIIRGNKTTKRVLVQV